MTAKSHAREIVFFVPGGEGEPVPWGSSKQWKRREAVVTAAKKAKENGWQAADNNLFDVEVTFWMPNPLKSSGDLDNLVKPVLDALFVSHNSQVEGSKGFKESGIKCACKVQGALAKCDDDRVVKLVLEKRCVGQQEKCQCGKVHEQSGACVRVSMLG